MAFLNLRYADREEDIAISLWIKKLPNCLKDLYIEKRNPYTVKETELLGARGFDVILPVTGDYAKKHCDKMDCLLKRTMDEFEKTGCDIAAAPYGVKLPAGLPQADGKIIFAFYLMDIIHKIYKYTDRDIRTAEIVILDGGNFLTELVVDVIYPNVNYLSIYTDRKENFEEKADYIYEDCGLNVQVFSNTKNALLRNADIVINCAMELENFDYFFKRNSLYLDVNKNRQKLLRLMAKRRDMVCIDDIKLKADRLFIMSGLFEACQYTSNPVFRNFLTKQYNSATERELYHYFKNAEAYVHDFYVNGKKLGSEVFRLISLPNKAG